MTKTVPNRRYADEFKREPLRAESVGINSDRVRIALALDCCDREVMSWVATTGGIAGDLVHDLIVEAIEAHFGSVLPEQPIAG